MSRKAKFKRRPVTPDSKYQSQKVTKLINGIMMGGKKSIAESLVYEALEKLGKETNQKPLDAFDTVLKNIMPAMEVKSRRVGGSTYQVPMEVRPKRAFSLAIRWLVSYARKRSGKSMALNLSNELIDIFNSTGGTVKKREETHKMAESNKAFAHFRW